MMITMASALRPGGSTRPWRRLRAYVLQRDNFTCYICGRGGADTVDHLVARIHGGGDEGANLKAAHRRCNAVKGSKIVIAPSSGMQPITSRTW